MVGEAGVDAAPAAEGIIQRLQHLRQAGMLIIQKDGVQMILLEFLTPRLQRSCSHHKVLSTACLHNDHRGSDGTDD